MANNRSKLGPPELKAVSSAAETNPLWIRAREEPVRGEESDTPVSHCDLDLSKTSHAASSYISRHGAHTLHTPFFIAPAPKTLCQHEHGPTRAELLSQPTAHVFHPLRKPRTRGATLAAICCQPPRMHCHSWSARAPRTHGPGVNYCVLQINDGARAIKREESQGNAS